MRTRRTLLVSAAVLAVAGGLTSAASAGYATFEDGPFGVHEEGVDWLSRSGVTAGCTPDRYCADDGVTRGQMATFLHRLSGHADGVTPAVDAATVGGRRAADLEVINGLVQVTERVRRTEALVDVTATCPAGTHALGGGGTIDGLYAKVSSAASSGGSAWSVTWVSLDHRAHEVDATVTVACAPSQVTTSGQAPSDTERSSTVDRQRDQTALRR